MKGVAEGGRAQVEGTFLAPDQPIPNVCGHAGLCCFNSVVGLLPFDVWRIITSPSQPGAQFGIQSTINLFGAVVENDILPPGPVALLGLGPDSKLPVSFLKPVRFGDPDTGATHCPFLLYDEDMISHKNKKRLAANELPGPGFWFVDGKPVFECGLGNAKPMQCDLYPFGRIGEPATEEHTGRWRFYCDTSPCKKCMPEQIKPHHQTVLEYLKNQDVALYLKQAQDYVNLMGYVANNVPVEGRMVIAESIFNFDQVLLQGGCTWDKVAESRPSDPSQLIAAAMFLAKSLFSGAEGGARRPQEESPAILVRDTELVTPETPKLILPGDPDFEG